jgi:hypothetical protein
MDKGISEISRQIFLSPPLVKYPSYGPPNRWVFAGACSGPTHGWEGAGTAAGGELTMVTGSVVNGL